MCPHKPFFSFSCGTLPARPKMNSENNKAQKMIRIRKKVVTLHPLTEKIAAGVVEW